jgi:cell division inhibitor SepF
VCIVNLQGADRTLLQRVVDFTSGVAYTIDGRIQKLADAIYLIVPSGVNVSSDGLKEQVDNDGLVDLAPKLHQNGSRFS